MSTKTTNINTPEFFFKIPDYENGLSRAANIAIQMGAMSSRLVLEERTRCVHPDGRAENVAEHGFMLAKVAPELVAELYPALDENLVARYAGIHDDVEAYVCDTATDRITPQGMLDKKEREKRGIEQLKLEYAHIPSYVQRVSEYEEQIIPEARAVRVVDKLMVLLIHLPNNGTVLKQNYTSEQLLDNSRRKATELHDEYPDFKALIDLRKELTHHAADLYLS